MGATQAQGMADAVSEGLATLEQALTYHLRSNHYPPIPFEMVPVAIAAIEAYNDGDYDRQITLPDGVSWRGQESAPASAICEELHLGAWLADYYDYADMPPEDYEE